MPVQLDPNARNAIIAGANDAGNVTNDAAAGNNVVHAPGDGQVGLGPVVVPDPNAAAPQIGRGRRVRPGAFDLIPGRYPDAIGLDVVLGKLANDPKAAAALDQIVLGFEARTGVKIPPETIAAVKANPSKLPDLLAVTPKQLSEGFDAMLALYRQGAIKDAAPKGAQLPQHFDLKKLANAPVAIPKLELKELAPGLFQGDVRSDLPDAKAKLNIAVAEIFDRLSENGTRPAAERFHLRYDGHDFTRLDSFVRHLQKNGHDVEVSFNHRIANFADLKTKTPDGKILDVPAALLVRTGVVKDGQEAVLPAAHAEMVVRIRSNDRTKGTKVDADVKFFQGMNATGFFACDIATVPSWCGYVHADKFQGEKAAKAIELTGLMSDVINSVAREQKLPFGAYGLTGVCMDSVEVVRHAMSGKLGYYPLLMRDKLLSPAIEKHLADHDRRDDPEYRLIRESMAAVPNDAEPDAAAARLRMLNSIPWPEGQEPFQSIVDARRILREAP